MMRRSFILPLITALVFLNCSRPEQTVQIEFWTLQLSPTFNEYFHSLIARYEKEHPGIRIRWVDIPYDAAVQKLLTSAVAGKAPDVVNLSADFLAKFHGMDALADLTVPVRESGMQFLPNALELCTFNGKLIALPWYLNSYVMLVNKQLLRRAGFTEKDIPSTFAELVPFIRAYKDRTGKFAFFWNIGKDSYLPMMLGSENIMMTDALLTEARFDSPEAVRALDAWVRLYRDGYLQRESVIKPGSTIVEAYQSGQAAMIFTGPVFLQRIRTNAPSVYRETVVAPAVVGVSGRHELAAMTLSVLSTSTHPREAADFALFVTEPANQLAFSKLTTTFPSVTEALRDSFFHAGNSSIEAEARVLGARQLPSAGRLRPYLLHPNFDRLRDAFDEAVQRSCLNDQPVQRSMEYAVKEWNTILKER